MRDYKNDAMTRSRTTSHKAVLVALVLLINLCLVCELIPILAELLPPMEPVKFRFLVALIGTCAVLFGVAAYLREWSLLWQVPSYGLAFSLLVVGLKVLVSRALTDWTHALDTTGLVCFAYIAGAAALGSLMWRLQSPLLSRHRGRSATAG